MQRGYMFWSLRVFFLCLRSNTHPHTHHVNLIIGQYDSVERLNTIPCENLYMELVILNLLRSEYTCFWFHYFPAKLCPEMFMAIELF